MRATRYFTLYTILLLVLLNTVVAGAQGSVTVVYPDGSTRTIPKTPYIESTTLYVGKYAMSGKVTEITGSTIIHVEGIGYIRLADIIVPAEKADQAKEYLSNLLLGKIVYLDIDDKNIIDQSGRIVAVVYLPINNTTVLNVNFDLVVKGYAYIFNEANEFNPSTWRLQEKIQSEPEKESTTTPTITVTTTTITVTSVMPLPQETETTTTTQPNETPVNETAPIALPSEGIVVIEESGGNNPPSPPVATTQLPIGTTYTVNPPKETVTKTVATTITVTYTVTTTIQRYLTFTLTAQGELPFHATPLGVSLIAALSALLGSLITIALLRKYIAT